jgi:hypothetical protein
VVSLTSLAIWDPYDECYGDDEHKLATTGIDYRPPDPESRTFSVFTTNLRSISNNFDDDNFLILMKSKVILT